MERGLVPWTREAAAAAAPFGAMESSPSRCSSGCQSGWTLYLDHSDGHRHCIPPCEPPPSWMVQQAEPQDDEEEEEDSMVSDASSGPPPRLRDDDEEEVRRDLEQGRRRCFFAGQSCHSSSGHRSASGSISGSDCFGSSTLSRSFLQGGAKSVDATRAVGLRVEEATRQYPGIIVIDEDDDDELDDTASSSAVFSCPMAMVHINFSS